MKTWKISFELSLSDKWVHDGLNLTEEERNNKVTEFFKEQLLPFDEIDEVIVNKLEVNEIN